MSIQNIRWSLLCLPLLSLLACASISPSDSELTAGVDSESLASPVDSSGDGIEVQAPQRVSGQAPFHAQMGLGPKITTVLEDVRYRDRFMASYLSETEIEPPVSDEEREVLSTVIGFITSNNLDEAVTELNRARNDSSSAVLDFMLGNIEFQRDRLDVSAAAYNVAVDKFPKFRRAWVNLGQVAFRLEDFDRAASSLSRVIQLGGGDAITFGLLGVAHMRLEEDIAAESAFRLAITQDPKNLDWKMGLAEAFYKQGRFADAASLFGRLIADQPGRADLWLAQGEAYARLGQPLLAAENFEMADTLGGASLSSLNNLGDIYANLEMFDLSVKAYIRAIEKDPKGDSDRVIRAAKFLAANGAFDDAKDLADALTSMRGDNLQKTEKKELLRIRARLAVASGADDEEAKVLLEIVELDPLDGDALILLGRHCRRGGEVEQAIFYFERAESLERFEADARVCHAQLLVGEGRYTEALPLLRRALVIKPRSNIQDYLAQVERVARVHR